MEYLPQRETFRRGNLIYSLTAKGSISRRFSRNGPVGCARSPKTGNQTLVRSNAKDNGASYFCSAGNGWRKDNPFRC